MPSFAKAMAGLPKLRRVKRSCAGAPHYGYRETHGRTNARTDLMRTKLHIKLAWIGIVYQ